ncbi:MAG: GTP-binding protein [Cyanobacteria bacterium P01_A01_bin.45]
MSNNQQETHLTRARASLRQAISWYGNLRKPKSSVSNPELARLVKPELDSLSFTLDKLNYSVIHIAAFGLVSRGKSAVLNALLGQNVLQTGPLNGVTKRPHSVRWNPGGKVEIKLIDTPGLDEIQGEVRARMAEDVAREADLILFVVSGDITRTEYAALKELRQSQKPLILVFNKTDLYPDTDKAAVYENLQKLGAANLTQKPLQPDEIVMVAAAPVPMKVGVEYPDGRVEYELETPPPQIQELKDIILKILNREGRSLLALNALVQAREAEESIAAKTIDLRQKQAEEIIWKFTRYKAIAVGLNPIAVLDIVGGSIADLALIRALAKLYGLPMTGYQASKVLKTILLSSGGLLLGEIGSSFLLGFGKSAGAIASGENPMNITAFAGTAITQAAISGYGTYAVGKAAQVYLEKGCSWGNLGVSTVISEILVEVDKDTILYRLQQELAGNFGKV